MKVVSIISAFVLVVGVLPNMSAADTTTAIQTVANGTYTSWQDDENEVDETSNFSCDSDDSIKSTGSNTDANARESYTVTIPGAVANGATITSVTVTVYDRGHSNPGGTYRTFVRLNGVNTDASTNLIASGGNGDPCSSAKSQNIDVPDTVKAAGTTLEIGVKKMSGTGNENNTVRIGAISATITYTQPIVDTDGDLVPDSSDNCPSVSNADQANNDGDAMGDACDADDDNDTVIDTTDNCDFTVNLNQSNIDGDTDGDLCDTDDDNDTVADASDNCPVTANTNQLDSDGDNIGNECDETPFTAEQLCEQQEGMSWVEGNCVSDEVPPTDEELCVEAGNNWVDGECLTDEDVCVDAGDHWIDGECIADNIICDVFEQLGIPMPEQCTPEVTDTDADSIPDSSDNCPTTANTDQADANNDGVGDVCDQTPNGDEDNEGECTENCGGDDEQTETTVETPTPPTGGGPLNKACNNSKDDDNDGLYDMNDPGCSSPSDKNESDEPIGGGDVLGATTCGPILNSFLGLRGKTNDPEAVKVVQTFLNKELGLSLDVNGEYDAATIDAVEKFQSKYLSDVLNPWGISDSTGIVYLTTQRMINMIACPSLDLPMPELK